MQAIKRLIYVKTYKRWRKRYITFDLPANQSLQEFQNDFKNYKEFHHLDLKNKYNGLIRAELSPGECSKECDIRKLLQKIIRKEMNNSISEGHVIIQNDDANKTLELQEWSETQKSTINNYGEIDNLETDSSHLTKKQGKWFVLNTGHGLSIFNQQKEIVFDAGGSMKHYGDWKKEITKTNKLKTFIISHAHRDHYNFLEKLIKEEGDSIVKQILINQNSDFNRSTAENIFNLLKKKGKKITGNQKWESFKIVQNFEKSKTENHNSLLLIDNSILLTGDQCYENIEKQNKNINYIQIPHHGSLNKDTGKPSNKNEFTKIKGFISSSGAYGLPSKGISEYFSDVSCTKNSDKSMIEIS